MENPNLTWSTELSAMKSNNKLFSNFSPSLSFLEKGKRQLRKSEKFSDALNVDHDSQRGKHEKLHITAQWPAPRHTDVIHVLVVINVVDIQQVPPPVSEVLIELFKSFCNPQLNWNHLLRTDQIVPKVLTINRNAIDQWRNTLRHQNRYSKDRGQPHKSVQHKPPKKRCISQKAVCSNFNDTCWVIN